MQTADCDVLIIGAGVAGLAAAGELARAGLCVAILEARNRLGGRIDTRHEQGWQVPVECGAEFVHGRPPETWDLIHAAGLTAVDVAASHWHRAASGELDQ